MEREKNLSFVGQDDVLDVNNKIMENVSIKDRYYKKYKSTFYVIFFILFGVFTIQLHSLNPQFIKVFKKDLYTYSIIATLFAFLISLISMIVKKSIFTRTTYWTFNSLSIILFFIASFNDPLSKGLHIIKIRGVFSFEGYIFSFGLIILVIGQLLKIAYKMQEELDQVI